MAERERDEYRRELARSCEALVLLRCVCCVLAVFMSVIGASNWAWDARREERFGSELAVRRTQDSAI